MDEVSTAVKVATAVINPVGAAAAALGETAGKAVAEALHPTPAAAPAPQSAGTVDPKDPGFVHYGNVRVEAAIAPDVEKAWAYLSKSPEGAAQIAALQKDPHTTTIKGITNQDDSYQPSTRTIEWDPKSALLTTDGKVQSAALGLLHEQQHATNYNNDPAAERARSQTFDPKYGDKEEKNVIDGIETTVANELHEGTRTNHGGTPFHTKDPVDLSPPPAHRAELTPAGSQHDIASALASARTNGQSTAPEPSDVKPWDGKAHTGSIVHIDGNTVAQSLGRGQYQVYDVQRDLHGVMPPAGDPNVTISPQGQVVAPHAQSLAQSH